MQGIDPKIPFILGICATIATGIGGGTVSLTNVVPHDWIPIVQGWNNLFAFVTNAILTTLIGASSTKAGPLTK
jgi:hypothetical protein